MKNLFNLCLRQGIGIQIAMLAVFAPTLSHVAFAQSEIRHGVLPVARLMEWENQSQVTLSTGVLADLQADPNFAGDYQYLYDIAANSLSGYTVVSRAGYFPENAGIPRDRQIVASQAVYYFFVLPNGNGLILYRSPAENTSHYMIRRPGTGFLLP
jgi:hypothetical protein